MSISNHSTTRKSWRSDTPIILPGWECHTGGSRSKPTVHRCRPKTGGCGLLTRTQDEPTKTTKQDTLSQQFLKRNSSQAVRIRGRHFDVQKYRRKTKRKIPFAASCASASLRRVEGFPVATKDRSGRAQCQANMTKNIKKKQSRKQQRARKKEVKTAAVHACGGKKAMVLREVRTHCSMVRRGKTT